VILACKDLADLQRASEWTEAARTWCEALPATTPYSQGLCRIYRLRNWLIQAIPASVALRTLVAGKRNR
jgi:hypothetical protein